MNNQLMAGEKLNTSNRYGKYSFSHACHKLENTKGAHSQSFGAYYGSQMVPLHITNGAFTYHINITLKTKVKMKMSSVAWCSYFQQATLNTWQDTEIIT
jgi:hypothetical protein